MLLLSTQTKQHHGKSLKCQNFWQRDHSSSNWKAKLFFLFTLPLAGNLAPLSWPIRRKVTCSSIPTLYVCYKHLLWFLIGSIDWHRQLWLARLNTFILILEKHSDKTRWTGFHTIYNYNLGKNKDEATRKPRRAIFPSLIWGGGGSKFVIYLSNIVLSFILNHLMIVSSSITTSQGLSAALGSVADLLMMACSLAQWPR